MSIRKSLISIVPILLFLSFAVSAKGRSVSARKTDELEAACSQWKALTEKGQMDSVIAAAVPYFNENRRSGFVPGVAYSSCYIAQAYHFKGVPDSSDVYLDYSESCFSDMESDTRWQIMFYNMKALSAIKTHMDYVEGIENLENAVHLVRKLKQPEKEIVLLCNMVSIFYNRRDTLLEHYAEEAYSLSSRVDNPALKCYSSICMGQMSILKNDSTMTRQYLEEAEKLASSYGIKHMLAPIWLLYGDSSKNEGKLAEAESFYVKALDLCRYAAPEVEIEAEVAYGNLLLQKGDAAEAEKHFRRGLELSRTHNDREQLYNIYLGLAESFNMTEAGDSALKYYVLYNEVRDSSAVGAYTERRLSRIRNFASDMAGRTSSSASLFVILVLAVGAAVFAGWHHMASSRSAAERKQHEQEAASRSRTKNGQEEQLFRQIQAVLSDESAYCDKELSLVKVAEKLGSNRSYVSKVINSYSGTNFQGYINKLRIDKAVALLSDPGYDKPLKVLADDLGYGSLSVFYRAFQRQTGISPSKFRSGQRFPDS